MDHDDRERPQVRVGIRFLTVDAPAESSLSRVIFQQMSAEAHRRRHLRGMRRLDGDPRERRDAYRVELGGPLARARLFAQVDTASALPPRSWEGYLCNLSLSGCAVCLERGSAGNPAPGSVVELSLPAVGLELRGVVVYLCELSPRG